MADNPLEAGEQKVESLLKSEPWYVWAAAAAAAGIVVYFVWQRKQTNSTSTALASTQPTLATDPNVPSGYQFANGPTGNFPFPEVQSGNQTVPVLPSGLTPIYDSNGNLIGWQQPSPTVSPTPPPGPPVQPPIMLPPPKIPIDPGPVPIGNPVQEPPSPPEQELIYTVQRGDTLSGIMQKLGLHSGWQALYNKNRSAIGPNPNLIIAGEKLDYTGIGGGGDFQPSVNTAINTVDQLAYGYGIHQHGDGGEL